jgi:hypothetical protein
MTTQQSKSCNDAKNSARNFLLRREIKLISRCVATSFCMVMALSPAMAGTDGTHTRMHSAAAKSALATASARQDDSESRVLIRGVSLAEWTQRFWIRFMSIPANVNPATDKTGLNCGINQSGPVWFLGAPLGGTNTLSCTIPAGKVILAPAVTFINDYPCPDPSFEPAPGQTLEDFLVQGVIPVIDSFTSTVELDGKPVKLRRVTTGLVSFSGARDLAPSIDVCVTGSPQLGVVDGQYAMISPLSPGLRILHVHIDSPIIGSSDNTFHLTIK